MNRRCKIPGGFVPIPNCLIDSPIWQFLTGADIKVYCQARRLAWKHREGFSLADDRFKRLMSHETLVNSRKKLVKLSLLELVERGELCAYRRASKYALSEEWRKLDHVYIETVVRQCTRLNAKRPVPPGRSNTVSEKPTMKNPGEPIVEKRLEALADNAKINLPAVGNLDNERMGE